MRRAGVDVMTVMRIIGHTSEKMPKRHNSIDEHDLRRAAKDEDVNATKGKASLEGLPWSNNMERD